jgi:midasin (ATPase involved in ribosome maturation)
MLQPFNPQTTKSELVGYMDATGKYVESPFYKSFKQGKLFIADEFDAANPAVATVLNAAVANRVMTFPNGETVKAHKDFRTMFAMNTYGTGGDDRFTGRGRLDLATLDRMVFLYVPIDPGLEASLVGIKNEKSPRVDVTEGGRFRNEREILHQIVSVRGAVEKEKLRYSISPRATIHACALHNAGFGKKIIMESCVWRGIPESEKSKIQKSMAA